MNSRRLTIVRVLIWSLILGLGLSLIPRQSTEFATYRDKDGPLQLSGTSLFVFGLFEIPIGTWKAFYKDGKLGKIAVYRNGYRVVEETYFPNGVVKQTRIFRKGRVSTAISSHRNGKISYVSRFDASSNVRDQYVYDENGEILMLFSDGVMKVDRTKESKRSGESQIQSSNINRSESD